MSLSASELYEAGMSLPASVRKDVALQLLRTIQPEEEFKADADTWLHGEAASAYDELKADPAIGIPAETVKARLGAKWAARS